jgi:hypothetical protein
LRPDGTLRFLEHVRSRRRGIARAQDLLAPLWYVAADGCHPNRDTLAAIEAAGFAVISLKQMQGPARPLLPTICGVARPQTRTCEAHAGEDVS